MSIYNPHYRTTQPPAWKWIHLEFADRFIRPILNGTKTKTTRPRWHGSAGDRFRVLDSVCELVYVEQTTLHDVVAHSLAKEGFDTPEEFIHAWCEFYPRLGFQPDQMVWLHTFRILKEEV